MRYQRERVYTGLGLTSALLALTIGRAPIFDFDGFVQMFCASLIGTITPLVFDAVASLLSGGRLTIKNPNQSLVTTDTTEQIVERLSGVGFLRSQERPEGQTLNKPKAASVSSFMDHNLQVDLVKLDSEQVKVTATMLDTILVETGEFEKLQKLAQFASGQRPTPSDPDIPELLYSSLFGGVLCGLMQVAAGFGHPVLANLQAEMAFLTAGMALYGLVKFRNRSLYRGQGFAFLTLLLGLTPYFNHYYR